MTESIAASLNQAAAGLDLAERLRLARSSIAGRMVFTTSFGLEDQVLTHVLCSADLDIDIVTLDTGRLFAETYDVWAQTERRYGRRIASVSPDAPALERLVAAQGINGFYDGTAQRQACCGARKIEPLGRALAGASGWITGLRAGQSAERDGVPFALLDAARGLLKLNPLHDRTRDSLLADAEAFDIPVNALHAKGFLSIGCAPCTRALRPGEPERAGRWWWEDAAAKECGLHVGADGKLQRVLA